MENWDITKEINFCYGHRVWSQQLDAEFCENGNAKPKCRHLHGHEGKLEVSMKSRELINGMVVDFSHLGWLKTWINDNLDHKFIIDKNDPLFKTLLPHYSNVENFGTGFDYHEFGDFYTPILLDDLYPAHCFELYEGLIVVNFLPTSENIAKWIYNLVIEKMKKFNLIISIKLFETPKSSAKYTNE